VALARAIVRKPRLLLLDEPLSNLDAALREEMRKELKKLQAQIGVTTVYVTHDQAEALEMSDHIAVMQQGRIVQLASPRDIYRNPSNAFVAGFVGSTNWLSGMARGDGSGMVVNLANSQSSIRCIQRKVELEGRDVLVSVRPETITLRRPLHCTRSNQPSDGKGFICRLLWRLDALSGQQQRVEARGLWIARQHME
jgi:iron(III) transport system ATP-binding protein